MNDDPKDDLLEGTQEKKIEIVRVGRRIAETGVIKTTNFEEKITSEGTLERINHVTLGTPDCGHISVEVGGQCPVCRRWFCKDCVAQYGTCFVCGGVTCPTCSDSTVLDKNKRYHKACWLESVRRKIFG